MKIENPGIGILKLEPMAVTNGPTFYILKK
jgi:hypothetical protein